jgi:hypothetical protein
MKRILLVFILMLSFQSLTRADDIRDFEIEGISIGDSALDFFDESDIKKNSKDYFKDKTYTPVQNDNYSFFKVYDAVDFSFKTGDNKYILHNINGILFYDNKDINECYKKMDKISSEIQSNINFIKKTNKIVSTHSADKTGKSKYTHVTFTLNDGYIVVTCYDYSVEHGSQNHLSVAVDTKKFNEWVVSGIY